MFAIKKTIFCLSILVIFPSLLVAEESDKNPLDYLKSRVEKFELSNGLRVIFLKRDWAPIFTGQMWVKVGGVNETPGMTGAAHLLEHMAFKGSQKIGTKDYGKEKGLLAELERMVEANESPEEIAKLRKQLSEIWNDNEFSRIYKRQGAVGLNAATSKDYTFLHGKSSVCRI